MDKTSTEDIAYQIKKNAAFEAVKSVCASYGAVTLGLTATICGARLLNGHLKNNEELKHINIEDFSKILGVSAFASLLLTPVHTIIGWASSHDAAWHNGKVDSFTKRLEQEKTDKTAAPSGQSL